MQPYSRYYIRRRATLKGKPKFRDMGERQSQSPPRFPRVDDDETRAFYRIMTTGQQEIAQSLQALTTIMERVVQPRIQEQGRGTPDHDNRSVAGS